jgi:hypothetical protein
MPGQPWTWHVRKDTPFWADKKVPRPPVQLTPPSTTGQRLLAGTPGEPGRKILSNTKQKQNKQLRRRSRSAATVVTASLVVCSSLMLFIHAGQAQQHIT